MDIRTWKWTVCIAPFRQQKKKNVPVYTMHGWLNICRLARSNRYNKKCSSYTVQELKYTYFLDLKSLASLIIKNRSTDTQGFKVNWLKIKVLKYEKTEPGIVQFKYNYSDEALKSIRVSGRGRPTKYPDNIKQLYDKPRLISILKKKAIPVEFYEWYQSILTCSKQKDTMIISESENESD